MEWGFKYGLIKEYILDNIRMIENMDTGFISGKTKDNIKGIGTMANNMD